jgi:hypothetical protein
MDIKACTNQTDKYIEYQNSRPDYVQAIQASIDLAVKHTILGKKLSVADFCGGTGDPPPKSRTAILYT